jgi:hypothetical protein
MPSGYDGRSMPRQVTVYNYRQDPLYPKIVRAAALLLQQSKVVTPIDVLITMHLLTPADVLAWRHGQVPYLEQVIQGNLSRLSRLLRILRFHAHDLNLVPSTTVYYRWGKHKLPLRFTKTGDTQLEAAYARHFVWPGKDPFFSHPPVDG